MSLVLQTLFISLTIGITGYCDLRGDKINASNTSSVNSKERFYT